MANSIDRNPIYLDTWNADQVITARNKSILVSKIRLRSAFAGDVLKLYDAAGNQVIEVRTTVNATPSDMDFPQPQRFNEGLVMISANQTGLGAGDVCWIYIA